MDAIDPYYVIYIGVFVGALLAYEGIRQSMSRGERGNEAKSRRMRMLESGATTAEVLQLLRAPQDGGLLSRLPFVSNLPKRMRQAGFTMKPQVFVGLCVAAAAVVALIATPLLGIVVAFPLAVAAGLVPFALVDAARKKRAARLITQLPDALELMARGLRVGHPLNATIASVAEQMPDPIGTEFGLLLDQVSYGDDVVSALREMAERIDEEDMHYLAVSVGIQHGTGGNLSRLLTVLSKVIRDRATMRRKIKAISAEGRASMWILSALPLVIFAAVNISSPEFYRGVSDDPLFMPIMGGIVALVVANFLLLRKLVNFKF